MLARRVELSLPIEPGTLPDPEQVVPVFHSFIRDRALDEVLVDVARYGHVKEGPIVLLVGLSSDYVIEVTAEGTRLAAVRKRDAAPEPARLHDVAERLVTMAALLESALPGLRFGTRELTLKVLDRLNAPNTPEAFERLSGEVGEFARAWLGDVVLERGTDPSGPLEIHIRRDAGEPIAKLRERLPARPA